LHEKLNRVQTFLLFAYISYSLVDLALFECGDRYHFPYILFPLISAAVAEPTDGIME
jgi:hypothetical protein